tara:strand:+ start:162 stop:410 length:249 start_codon:yes stop_codon:yes gene_type:complete
MKEFQHSALMSELKDIKALLFSIKKSSINIDDWLNQKSTMLFLDYSYSQLRRLEKNGLVQFKKIGRRKFYSARSIKRLIEKG